MDLKTVVAYARELEKRINVLEDKEKYSANKYSISDVVNEPMPKNILDLIVDALDLEDQEEMNIPIYDSDTHKYIRIIELWDKQEYERATKRMDRLGHQQLKELYKTIKEGPYTVDPNLIDFVWDKI